MNDEAAKQNGSKGALPATFWLANLMEFFERGAYYGLNAVLAVYLAEHLKFSVESVGFLQGFVYALTYITPIAGGALAERLGYRKMLMVAFSLLTVGYLAAGNFTAYGAVFVSLLVMGTGSGLFKPIISGTIARTTTKETSGFGFGVYYWCINVGAFIAPFIINVLKGISWRYVFLNSAAWCALMLIPTVFFFKDPEKPQSAKTARQVAAEALTVLGDSRFMLMILIYSGFWVLYFQTFGPALWFVRDFVNRDVVTQWMSGIPVLKFFVFDAEFVTIVNAGVIIALVLVVSRICKNLRPIPVIASGIGIGALGFVILAFSHGPWMFILGIAVFSIGEMTAHPKYYSYIGLVAPKDRVAVYMGYAFLYGVVGSLFGSNFGAVMYHKILTPVIPAGDALRSGVPLGPGAIAGIRTFWLIFVCLGVLCLVGMLFYNRFFAEDTGDTRKKAWKIMLGVYAFLAVSGLFFFARSLFAAEEIQWKAVIQSIILMGLGGGGIVLSLTRRGQGA
jgi:POT family proton-dependent oligopeptide transporter